MHVLTIQHSATRQQNSDNIWHTLDLLLQKSMTNERGHDVLHIYYGGPSYDQLLSVLVVCSLGSSC